jgi:HlyD family secretion protein
MRLADDCRKHRHLRWALCAALLTVAGISSAGWALGSADLQHATSGPPSTASLPITAPGRIQPRDGVIVLAAMAPDGGTAIVSELRVRQGDWVSHGQILAILNGKAESEARSEARQRRVEVVRARLAALIAGAKADDLEAVRAEVLSDEAARAHAEEETQRATRLHEAGLLDTATLRAQELRLAIAVRVLEARRARLSGLSSTRPADLAVAQAELREADAEMHEARTSLANTIVRAPFDGRVLAVLAQPGQSVGSGGLLTFGRTKEMFVDAEVLEEDLAQIRVGQNARITGATLPGVLDGIVEEIGLVVGSPEVFKNDPTAFADSRIVHVKIRATDPEPLERSINARVTAVIQR